LFSVPYAVDNDSFIQAAGRWRTERDRLRESCGIRNEDVVFLFSGKLITKKRPLDLLQAYETVRSAKRCSLIVVGDGDLRPLMEARIRERRIPDVFLMGFRNQNEIAKFYSIADVLVLPSDSEPWGLVVNEAMCCGLAIVVSDQVGSAYDLVREGQNGYVFPCGDADALAERLQRLLADHEHLRKMQRASRLAIDGWGFEQDVAGVEAALRFVGGAGA
jgi:glycosyltransferase involved in cell wall biosynthesis